MPYFGNKASKYNKNNYIVEPTEKSESTDEFMKSTEATLSF